MDTSIAQKRPQAGPTTDGWERLEPRLGEAPGARAALGLIALATDRVGAYDTETYLQGLDGVAMFSTRIPMAEVATPQTLAAVGPHIEGATRLLVPGSRLDAVGFSCTSGTVAIGVEKVRAAIQKVRPGIHVSTPIEAGAEGLRSFGAKRISLLVPYLVATADLIGGYFEAHGFTIDRKATFELGGDPDMNRVSVESLVESGRRVCHPDSDALFISCTGLCTARAIAPLEAALGKPVVTSNQALAWHLLRLAGAKDTPKGFGSLFENH
jgi:maleate isomerase